MLAIINTSLTFKRIRVHFTRTLAVLPMFAPTTVPKLFMKYLVKGALKNTVLPSVVFNDLTALVNTVFA